MHITQPFPNPLLSEEQIEHPTIGIIGTPRRGQKKAETKNSLSPSRETEPYRAVLAMPTWSIIPQSGKAETRTMMIRRCIFVTMTCQGQL
jgi:hypothetical protein